MPRQTPTLHSIRWMLISLAFIAAFSFSPVQKSEARNAIGFNEKLGYGTDYSNREGTLFTHAVDKKFPDEGTPLYNVRVGNGYVGLYRDITYTGGLVHFGSFEMRNGTPVVIFISYYKPINTYEILPEKQLELDEVKQVSSHCIRIVLSRADQNITLVVNGELTKNVLHLFANSIDCVDKPNVPDSEGYHCYTDKKLYYFGKGHYEIKDITGSPEFKVENGWKLYIDAGAVVHGQIRISSVQGDTHVYGRGMVYTDNTDHGSVFITSWSKGADAHGLIFHTHRPQCWQVIIDHSNNIEFKQLKIISTRYASTDGIDIVNSQQCTVLNTFVRAADDAIAIKGLGGVPAECPPNEHLYFCGMQLWNDCNNAFGIGAENHCSLYNDIRFMNSSVLYSHDDPDYHEQLEERAALGICCINGTYFKDISYSNIDIYHCDRLIAVGFYPSFWFGYLKGDQSTPGGMKNIKFQNINSYNNSGSRIANKIHLKAWNEKSTPSKKIDGVLFDNVNIEGKRLSSLNDSFFSETDMQGIFNVTFK